MTLLHNSGLLCAGGAFELAEPATESHKISVDDRWEVELCKGAEMVVARALDSIHEDEVFSEALAAAQRGLDLVSIAGRGNSTISGQDKDSVIWWPSSGGMILRASSIGVASIDAPPVTLTVRGQDGEIVPPTPQSSVIWHESFRYFRLPQTTDDPFDAYRNAYLALESILSDIAPQRTDSKGWVREREGDWFKRALSAANSQVGLSEYTPADTEDVAEALFEEFYLRIRSAISHAKSGRRVLLPRNEDERHEVIDGLQRLVRLYLKLAESQLGARRISGGMFAVAFRGGLEPLLNSMRLIVSDDKSPPNKQDTVANPGGGTLVELDAQGPATTLDPFTVARRWSIQMGSTGELVRRIVGVDSSLAPQIAVHLNGPLELPPDWLLEVELGMRGINVRQPKERYLL